MKEDDGEGDEKTDDEDVEEDEAGTDRPEHLPSPERNQRTPNRRKKKGTILDDVSPPLARLCPPTASKTATFASRVGVLNATPNVTPTTPTTPSASCPGLFSATPTTSDPTEARLRQKERLKKEKGAGMLPKKKKKIIEDGHDDCCDDISGPGHDVTLLSCDWIPEDISDDDVDGDEEIFLTIPTSPHDNNTNVSSAVATLCYGRHSCVDLLELRGGEGRISQVAFRRGLESGGNLDLVAGCDLGDPATQRAINHYLDMCVAYWSPSCSRTAAPPAETHITTLFITTTRWSRHRQQDLPHTKYCGQVALTQIRKGWYFPREESLGTWIDDIPPWTTVGQRAPVFKVTMDQCMTGAADEDGTRQKAYRVVRQ